MSQQYSETIKHHYHHPLNTGKLSNYTHSAEQLNPLCGDETNVYLKIVNSKIKNCTHESRGCMISIAAASVLSEFVKGKTLQEAKKITKENIDKLLGVKISKSRESCKTLVLNTVKKI